MRFKAGLVTQTEVAQVDSQYQQALAAIPAIEQAMGGGRVDIAGSIAPKPQGLAAIPAS